MSGYNNHFLWHLTKYANEGCVEKSFKEHATRSAPRAEQSITINFHIWRMSSENELIDLPFLFYESLNKCTHAWAQKLCKFPCTGTWKLFLFLAPHVEVVWEEESTARVRLCECVCTRESACMWWCVGCVFTWPGIKQKVFYPVLDFRLKLVLVSFN